jgi:hypothetical protein
MFFDPYGLSSFWSNFGNGLNNTVSAIGQSMGQGLYDLRHWHWSQNEYNRIANLMYSFDTPENPAATPYVAGALGVSTVAAATAWTAGCMATYAAATESAAIDELFAANEALENAWTEVRIAEALQGASADATVAGSAEWEALELQIESAYFKVGVAEGNVLWAQQTYQAIAEAVASFWGF